MHTHDLENKTIFVGLTSGQIQKIIDCSQEITVARGKAIVEKDEPGDAMYVILDGSVKVLDIYGDEATTITHLSGHAGLDNQYEGDFFGEMALLDTEPRSTTVVAREPCRLLKLERNALATLFADDTALHVALINNIARILSRRLRSANPKISD